MLHFFSRVFSFASCFSLLFSGLAQAAPSCIPVAGFVRLDPDPTCSITSKYSGPNYLVSLGAAPPSAACFSVSIRGPLGQGLIATGSAGLTVEGHISPVSSSAGATPSVINESGVPSIVDEFGFQETRRFVTGRSAIDFLGGRLFTADAGVLAPPTASNTKGLGATEQLVITGGTGVWKGATGVFYANGSSIQNWAALAGQVCRP